MGDKQGEKGERNWFRLVVPVVGGNLSPSVWYHSQTRTSLLLSSGPIIDCDDNGQQHNDVNKMDTWTVSIERERGGRKRTKLQGFEIDGCEEPEYRSNRSLTSHFWEEESERIDSFFLNLHKST